MSLRLDSEIYHPESRFQAVTWEVILESTVKGVSICKVWWGRESAMCTGEVPSWETRPQSSQDGWDSGGPTSQLFSLKGEGAPGSWSMLGCSRASFTTSYYHVSLWRLQSCSPEVTFTPRYKFIYSPAIDRLTLHSQTSVNLYHPTWWTKNIERASLHSLL